MTDVEDGLRLNDTGLADLQSTCSCDKLLEMDIYSVGFLLEQTDGGVSFGNFIDQTSDGPVEFEFSDRWNFLHSL
jgi:hypothetical protein